MSKILQNTTASPVVLADVGVTVPASGSYTINTNDYLLFAGSSNTITQIGNGTLTVNDGSATLNIANGTALIQGLYPTSITVKDSSGNSIVIGQTVMSSSFPVVLASNQSALLIKDTTGGSITIGQKAMASSVPVTIASDQTKFGVNLNDGAGTSITVGQKTMASSLPIVLASDQTDIPIRISYNEVNTYMATATPFTPPNSATDLVVIQGSSTKTIKVQQIVLSATQTTAGINTFYLKKYSTINTGGSSTAPVKVAFDSNDTAATATVLQYCTNPTTLGTLVGSLSIIKICTPTPSGNVQPIYTWDFTSTGPIILRGTAQQLSLNFNATTPPSGFSMACHIIWTEE